MCKYIWVCAYIDVGANVCVVIYVRACACVCIHVDVRGQLWLLFFSALSTLFLR